MTFRARFLVGTGHKLSLLNYVYQAAYLSGNNSSVVHSNLNILFSSRVFYFWSTYLKGQGYQDLAYPKARITETAPVKACSKVVRPRRTSVENI